MANSIQNYLLRKAMANSMSKQKSTANSDVTDNIVTQDPTVVQSMESYQPNYTLLNAKKALIDQQTEGAVKREYAKGQVGEERDRLKSQEAFQAKKHQVGLDIRKAKLMQKMGLDATGHPLSKPGARMAQEKTGYKNASEVPAVGPGGLPLQSADTSDYGFIKPKYGRSKESQAAYDEQTAKDNALTRKLKQSKFEQESAAVEPGIVQKVGNFFYNPKAGSIGKGMMDRNGGGDYDNLSEDELWEKAKAGDQQAIALGKKKFGNK